jgi:hypothetical protein
MTMNVTKEVRNVQKTRRIVGMFEMVTEVPVKASAKTLSSYFVVFAYIAYNLAQS